MLVGLLPVLLFRRDFVAFAMRTQAGGSLGQGRFQFTAPFLAIIRLGRTCLLIGLDQGDGDVIGDQAQNDARPKRTNEIGPVNLVPELDQTIPVRHIAVEDRQRIEPQIRGGLFGGAASRVVIPALRALRISEALGERGTLLALAATAYHAVHAGGSTLPELIVGHGVLGRVIARIAVLAGATPVVWDTNPARRDGAIGYEVIDPNDDTRANYRCIVDVSSALSTSATGVLGA